MYGCMEPKQVAEARDRDVCDAVVEVSDVLRSVGRERMENVLDNAMLKPGCSYGTFYCVPLMRFNESGPRST